MIFLFWLAVQSHWTTVNGHRLYYETMGRGRPVLLLHGGGNNVHGSFDKQLDAFESQLSVQTGKALTAQQAQILLTLERALR